MCRFALNRTHLDIHTRVSFSPCFSTLICSVCWASFVHSIHPVLQWSLIHKIFTCPDTYVHSSIICRYAFARSPTYEQSIDSKINGSIRCWCFCWSDFRCQRRCKSIQSTPEQIWIIHVYNMKSKNLFLCTQCTSNCLTREDAHFVYNDHSFTFFLPLVLFSSFPLLWLFSSSSISMYMSPFLFLFVS